MLSALQIILGFKFVQLRTILPKKKKKVSLRTTRVQKRPLLKIFPKGYSVWSSLIGQNLLGLVIFSSWRQNKETVVLKLLYWK